MDNIIKQVDLEVSPSEKEVAELSETANQIREKALTEASKLNLSVDVIQTGSTARGTWVSGDRDIDLFVRFDSNLSDSELKQNGLELGEKVLPDGKNDFASHPYRVGTVNGFDIDLVPCFDVESASNIQSAVDRTPFHTLYLKEQLTESLTSDVRVAKMFLKGIGAYGSDVQTQGFSGYLTELLILEAGGFKSLIKQASLWELPIHIDLENHGEKEFGEDSLVVIDPTDPERNVAANLSKENLLRFILNSRRFKQNPSVEFFQRNERKDMEFVQNMVRERDTDITAIVMPRPNIVDDTLFPQMRRTRQSIIQSLEEKGFNVVRSTEMANTEEAVLFIELENIELSNVERVSGPPVTIQDGAENFIDKYEDKSNIVGPFIDGERLHIERPREYTSVDSFIKSDNLLEGVAMRADIEKVFNSDQRKVLSNESALEYLRQSGFEKELTQYFDHSF